MNFSQVLFCRCRCTKLIIIFDPHSRMTADHNYYSMTRGCNITTPVTLTSNIRSIITAAVVNLGLGGHNIMARVILFRGDQIFYYNLLCFGRCSYARCLVEDMSLPCHLEQIALNVAINGLFFCLCLNYEYNYIEKETIHVLNTLYFKNLFA